jgi:hypothetical protein
LSESAFAVGTLTQSIQWNKIRSNFALHKSLFLPRQ